MAHIRGCLARRKARFLDGDEVKQSTIARPVECQGLGLHSGAKVRLSLAPGAADSGIVFIRVGVDCSPAVSEIPARLFSLFSGSRATTLGHPGESGRDAAISTVEHLLATLYMLSIDNVRIEVNGPEIPAMDGSAAPLVDFVRSAGRAIQGALRTPIVLTEAIEIRERDRWIRAEPADRLDISYTIDFDHPCIGRQTFELADLDADRFVRDLASARTFGFAHEVASLRELGLARGGGLENTVVLGEEDVLNEGGLRFPDEFVRHKVIDLIGDLALLGGPLNAHVRVEKGGHALHHRLVRAIASATPDKLRPRPSYLKEDVVVDSYSQ